MRKIFTLLAVAMMAVCTQAQEKFLFSPTETYTDGQVIEASANVKLTIGPDGKLSKKNFTAGETNAEFAQTYTNADGEQTTQIVYLTGGNNPKDGEFDGSTSTGSGYKPDSKNNPQSGTFFVLNTKQAGSMTAGVILNSGKSFYVTKSDGSALPTSELELITPEGETVTLDENNQSADKFYGLVKFQAEAGESYYLFCAGSKISFYGYIFAPSGGGTETESNKKLVDMTGYSLYRNDYVQKEDGTWGYDPVKLDEPTLYDYNRYYYNGANQNSVETTSSAHYRYNYNADGTVASRESWTSAGGSFHKSLVNEYEYDAAKNCIKMTSTSYDNQGAATPTGGSLYEDYENGYYKVMKNFSADGTITYETHNVLTFNDANQLVSSIQMTGAEFDQPGQGTFYTYENGVLVKQVTAYYTPGAAESEQWSNVTSTINYTYNSDGTINTKTEVSDLRGMHSEVEWRHTYATLDPALIPQNLSADGSIGGNEVYLKWDAVPDATGYVVMYDNNTAEVEGKTEFITPMLIDGLHYFAVQAVVGGEKKNLSDFVTASVKDEGNLPMENFRVLAAEKVEVESYGYISYYYNLTLEWDVPAGASPISDYKVYVDKGDTWYPSTNYTTAMPEAEKKENYNDVNHWVTDRQNFYWTTFEDTQYNEDTYETESLGKGPDCKLWICAIYATGESQPSNVVELNVYNLANGEDGIVNVESANENAPVEMYNISGQRIDNPVRGQVYVVKKGNSVKKMLK